jgi:hypothetical protein
MKKNSTIIGSVLLISMLMIFPAYAVSCSLNLPDQEVVLTPTYTFPIPGAESFFVSTLSGVPNGYDVTNGDYLGWCIDLTHDGIPVGSMNVKLISSCNIPAMYMGEVWATENWNKVNYILNHKPEIVNNGDILDIQMAIWNFVDNIPGEGDNDPYHDPSPDCLALISAANSFGATYVPEVGQVVAVICYTEIDTQLTIIEVEVPEDGDYEGLTPGFWKNHIDVWPTTVIDHNGNPIDPTTATFADVFGTTGTNLDDLTLLQALSNGGGVNEKKGKYAALGRHAVAALLNSAHPEVNYPLTQSEIIDSVYEAITNADLTDAGPLKNMLDTYNNYGGGIDAHGNPI